MTRPNRQRKVVTEIVPDGRGAAAWRAPAGVPVGLGDETAGGRAGSSIAASVSVSIRSRACHFPFWPTLGGESPGHCFAFQCADVLDVWCDSIGAAQRVEPLFVAVTTIGGAPLLLLPLGIERRHGLRILGFLDGTVSDFNAPVVFAPADGWDEATMRDVWAKVQRALPAYDVAIFRKMPATIDGVDNPLRHLATARSSQGAHAIPLSDDWESAARDILPNPRETRRRLRKLSQAGEVAFRVAQTTEQAVELTRAAMAMKGKRLTATIGVDRFASEPGYAAYYLEMIRRLFPTGAVHVSALTVDGAPRAAHWGFAFAGRFYFLLTAFDDAWRSYSPGRMHKEHLIEWAATAGYTTFDLGVGDEAYKSGYATRYQHLSDAILPRTLHGAAYGLAADLRTYLSRRVRGSALAPWAERLRRGLNRWRQPSQAAAARRAEPAG